MNQHEFSKEQRLFIEGMRQPFAVCQFLEKGVVTLAVSDGFCSLFGYQNRKEAYDGMNRNMFRDVHPEDTAAFTNAILRFSTQERKIEIIYRVKKMDGAGYRIIRLCGERVSDPDGAQLAHLWFTDEGDYQEARGTDLNRAANQAFRQEGLKDAARYDYLTGLPNMGYFFELAEVGRKIIQDHGGQPALLYIDLSGMKHYNHTFGFAEGDKMLRYFAQLLSRAFQPVHCCHIVADRFAAVADENGLEEKLEKMFADWQQMGEGRYLPICVGIYPNRIESVPVGMAFDRAKIACDALGTMLTSSYHYFSMELNEGIEKKQYILDHFEEALEKNWIQVYYQPIIRAVNGKICDEESLARWIDPAKGFLSPADFIQYLEEADLIYKLDLYVLEKTLGHIKIKMAEGMHIVPHSINLSRSDFDSCDMVEEVRRRVDAAGVSRDRISIEITESVIGSDFDFMKEQVARFQALGFPVWMDDFGSGYSSLDVLQTIKFYLLKFDMGFMRKLDESENGRIILTELMKMALALGIDTICEGVETEDQVRFLQEIGCSKLQGYYFSRPLSPATLREWQKISKLSGFENPQESAYYDLLCGVNLYDVSVIAREEKDSLQNTYKTVPMSIIEVKGDSTRFVRSNQSYRDFIKRFFGLDLSNLGPDFVKYDAAFMHNVVKACCEQGIRTFYDEKMPDGSIVHSFARRIGTNPVSGITAIAIAVLSIREPNERLMVEQILSVIEQFGEHMPGGFFIYRAEGNEELLYANKAVCDIFGCGSLEEFKALTGFTFRGMVHPDDYDRISVSIEEQVAASRDDLDFVEYRIIRKDGAVRWLDDYGHYFRYDENTSLYYVFISDVTAKYERRQSDKALRSAVIEALTRPYDSVWLIHDMETQRFELYRLDGKTAHLAAAQEAVKIPKFYDAFAYYSSLVLEEDRARFLRSVSPESILRGTENRMIYSVPYRRVFEDGIRSYRVEFTKMELENGEFSTVVGFKEAEEEPKKE